jgi:hypothetical protein
MSCSFQWQALFHYCHISNLVQQQKFVNKVHNIVIFYEISTRSCSSMDHKLICYNYPYAMSSLSAFLVVIGIRRHPESTSADMLNALVQQTGLAV